MINLPIKIILDDGELAEDSVIKKNLTTQNRTIQNFWIVENAVAFPMQKEEYLPFPE